MSKKMEELTPRLIKFIKSQKIFFTGTAASEGFVNVSPKGMDSLRILSPKRVMWLNLTGSGNETAAHIIANNRITIMFCAFEGKPLILRLYGKAKIYHHTDREFIEYKDLFPDFAGTRQLFDIELEMVMTSCGMAVPFMEYTKERRELEVWAEKKGKAKIKDYWDEKNRESIDGYKTGIEVQL